ncbi:peptidylprolyl isomerase [Ancylomarina salipaludis]|uniref:Periplasmic chaperone PpiD n=1 Tax=Ancylomarina salipaludis TaxID=2501299 RepID=A0A4Q1JJ75_9BACT|nr:peptidylprolyl isomerase [Ancylomarina salipaludis]RXQ89893.1 peptidylprolyl isomerase [Ancylomarina salipaludis]
MATLQKIRNRGVFIGIIIGGALLAFIAGDALKSGGSLLTNSRNEMAEIAGESVNIRDFQNRFNHNLEVTKLMSGQNSIPADQMDKIREQVWQQMVQEIVMNREYDELGISLTSQELFDMVQGKNIDPTIRQLFTGENGQFDKDNVVKTLKQLIAAPDGTPQKAYWLNIEESLIAQRTLTKYNALIAKGLYIPTAYAKNMAANGSKKVNFDYVVKSYNSISDSTVNVTAEEIKAYYNDHKELFKQSESRKIDYVLFNIEPSTDDFKYTEKWIADMKADFTAEENVAQFLELNSDTKFNSYYFAEGENSNKALDAFMFSGKKGDVFGPYDEKDAYKLAKISDIKMMADSVKARHILIRPVQGDFKAAEAKADSLKLLLDKGADFAELAKTNSDDQGSAVNGGDLGWFTQGRMVPAFNDAAFSSKKNEVKIVKTQFGAHLIQVVGLSKAVKKVQVAILDRKVEASQKTFQAAYSAARKFAGENQDRASFFKAISEQNLTHRVANLKKDTKLIPGLESSRELIRVAYNTDNMETILLNNDNSAVFEFGDKFVVAILSNIKEEGYASVTDVQATVEREVRKNKKAEMIIASMSKNAKGAQSLLSVAQKENLEVKNAADVTFQSFQIPGAGIEPNVIANASNIEKGMLSAPIKGNQGVYMILVNDVKEDALTQDAIDVFKSRMNQNYQYRTNYQSMQVLRENADIVDKRYKFY